MNLAEAIAQNARLLNDPRFEDAAYARQKRICDALPSGSGINNGTKLISADTRRIIFECGFHHMNEAGFYDGWTDHRITIRPSFIGGFDIYISGRDRNGIKDYLCDVFSAALHEKFDWINHA